MRRTIGSMLLAASALAAPAHADTLVDNIKGETIAPDGTLQSFAAFLFDDSGVIKTVYRPGDKLPKPGRKGYQFHIDGKGRVLLPGLIDAHGHVMQTGYALLTLDLSETTSLSDALARIKAFAAAHPDRPWIIGSGWNQERWGLGRFPTAAELDSAVGDRPVWLERADYHAGWANSAAFKAAGITASTPTPEGGAIERLADGRPAGVLVDKAQGLVDKAVPPPTPRDDDLALTTAEADLARRGVTGIADMGTSTRDWMTFRRAGDANRLYLRIMAYAAGTDTMAEIAGPGPTPWLYADRLRMGGVKLFLDGALGSRGAWLKAPYADKPDTHGLSLLSETQLGNLMSRAAMDGFQVAVHAIGDKANGVLLTTIEDLSHTYHGDRRWRVEHAQIIDPADWPLVTRIAANGGIVASMQPVHQTSDRLMAEARLGPDRLKGAYAWASLKQAGAVLAFGSDTPVELPDPWTGIAVALTRQDASGAPAGGWRPEERVDSLTALAGYTSAAAYAGFAETRFGRIAPGLRADFILVDTDPMTASPEAIRKTHVLQTWIGGGKVYDAESPAGGK
ncbi:amidohydrolase [Novosphingobium nitrogenifigens DSM 19370]|uniref:Amidohydrolase n=2 Tax=Novosphingobium nitrogenifigens TaxID=378548 RepID=F1ZD89_9SPHN|nr:amidohydrolase [Novosphingobium nitrogenifigens DSM 19370]